MRHKVTAAAALTAAYFATAYYLQISHVEGVPHGDNVAIIPRILRTGTPGTFYAHLWLPIWATKAIVYEDGVSIGEANVIYDDATRPDTRGGKRWKLVEFNSKGEDVRRWIVFRALRTP